MIFDLRKFFRDIESLVFVFSPFCKRPDSKMDEIIERAFMPLYWGSTSGMARSPE
jgi:hypothetical protein